MLKSISNLGKSLNKQDQKSFNGGFGDQGCNIFVCTPTSEGCPCWGAPTPTGRGYCFNGMCCD